MIYSDFIKEKLFWNREDWKERIDNFFFQEKSISPLIVFRILFGILMAYGAIRFMYYGWIEKLYDTPKYFFHFPYFDWIQSLDVHGMYQIYSIIALSGLFIAIGFLYRISIITFFLTFSYAELIDATNYLNHYYLVALLAFLMIFLPANRNLSIDALIFPIIRKEKISAWCINIIIFQLCIVYFYAGIAKINSDWLFQAMPMTVWLPERQYYPILGYFFTLPWTPYIASWFGCIYDTTIWIFLLNKKTRWIAYIFVLVFHILTKILFNIGLFPLIMITSTLIFFSHKYLPLWKEEKSISPFGRGLRGRITTIFLFSYIFAQILLPLRCHLYGGNVLWHEQGYRLSWRVMLVEKNGIATFRIHDKSTGESAEIINSRYLTKFQEKQMTIQPDFILQFARIIAADYKNKGLVKDPKVTADIHIALNGRSSQRFIKNDVDLLDITNQTDYTKWILPFKE